MTTNASAEAKRTAGYEKRSNDLITAKECTLIVDHRVSILLAYWEDERRKRERDRRLHRRLWRWLAVAIALVRPVRTAPTQSEEVVG
jgi:hypothetical protein